VTNEDVVEVVQPDRRFVLRSMSRGGSDRRPVLHNTASVPDSTETRKKTSLGERLAPDTATVPVRLNYGNLLEAGVMRYTTPAIDRILNDQHFNRLREPDCTFMTVSVGRLERRRSRAAP